jgi:hypothetical protein
MQSQAETVPTVDAWLHEARLDGYRLQMVSPRGDTNKINELNPLVAAIAGRGTPAE